MSARKRKQAQKSADARTQKNTKERKRAQKGAKERKRALPRTKDRKRALPRTNGKQPGLKQPGVLGTPKTWMPRSLAISTPTRLRFEIAMTFVESLRFQLRLLPCFEQIWRRFLVVISLALCDLRSLAISWRFQITAIAILRFRHLSPKCKSGASTNARDSTESAHDCTFCALFVQKSTAI